MQYYILFPPHLAQQLAWSRFINTRGKLGTNIPADPHQEHLNWTCKEALEANSTPKAIQRIGKCIGPLTMLCHAFDETTGIPPISTAHSVADIDKKDGGIKS